MISASLPIDNVFLAAAIAFRHEYSFNRKYLLASWELNCYDLSECPQVKQCLRVATVLRNPISTIWTCGSCFVSTKRSAGSWEVEAWDGPASWFISRSVSSTFFYRRKFDIYCVRFMVSSNNSLFNSIFCLTVFEVCMSQLQHFLWLHGRSQEATPGGSWKTVAYGSQWGCTTW